MEGIVVRGRFWSLFDFISVTFVVLQTLFSRSYILFASVDTQQWKVGQFAETYRHPQQSFHEQHLSKCMSVAVRERQTSVLVHSLCRHNEEQVWNGRSAAVLVDLHKLLISSVKFAHTIWYFLHFSKLTVCRRSRSLTSYWRSEVQLPGRRAWHIYPSNIVTVWITLNHSEIECIVNFVYWNYRDLFLWI